MRFRSQPLFPLTFSSSSALVMLTQYKHEVCSQIVAPFFLDAISFRFIHHSLDALPVSSRIGNRYFALLVRLFHSRDAFDVDVKYKLKGPWRFHGKENPAALWSRPLPLFRPFSRMSAFDFFPSLPRIPSVPFANRRPDAYPNGLTIPSESSSSIRLVRRWQTGNLETWRSPSAPALIP